jgi:hypothetical protein
MQITSLKCVPCRGLALRFAGPGAATMERLAMIVLAAFAFLVLFSIVAIVLGDEDSRGYRDPYDNPLLWTALSRR